MAASMRHVCVLLLTVAVLHCLTPSVSGGFCEVSYQKRVLDISYSYRWVSCWSYRPCRWYWYHWWYWYYWRYWYCRYRYSCRRWRATYSYRYVTRTKKVCCEGYKGKNCDIPICADCGTNGVCIAPEKCFCGSGSSGPNCKLDKCSSTNLCYPGSCDTEDVTNKCNCVSGFAGSKCDNFKEAGTLDQCSIKFQNEKLEDILTAECGPDENGETKKFYTNESLPRWLVADYNLQYVVPDDLPGRPSYVQDVALGLTGSTVEPRLYDAEGTNVWTRGNIECNVAVASGSDPPSQDEPYLSLECNDVKDTWANTVAHNFKLTINVTSTSGGFKKYLDENLIPHNDYYVGKTESQEVVEIIFDLEAPIHCKERKDCTDELETPCEVNPEISKFSTASVEWDGWKDEDSGIDSFKYTVYKMIQDENGQLVEGDVAIETTTLTVFDPMPDITVPEPGLYSFWLEVSDVAGNIAKARSFYLYDNSSIIEVIRENDLGISGATVVGDKYWITNPQNSLEISWFNRYTNSFLHSNGYLNGIKGVPDILDDDYGNFTIAKKPNAQGITKFGIVVSLKEERPEEDDFTEVDVTSPSFTSPIAQNAGTVIYVYVYASDILGNVQVEYVPVGVDTSEATLEGSINVVKNANKTLADIPYGSSVAIPVKDPQSGIFSINYTLTDVVADTVVIESSQLGQTHPEHKTEEECDATGDCYCAALGECFNDIQTVWINNCLLEGLEGRVLRMDFDVYNGAGMVISDSHALGKFDTIVGLGFYPAPQDPTFVLDSDVFYKVNLYWQYLPSCYKAETIIVSYSTGSSTYTETVPANKNTLEIDNLLPDTDYDMDLRIQYEGGRSSDAVTISFRSNDHPDNQGGAEGADPQLSDNHGGGLGTGPIIAIVAVGIIVAVLLAGVIVLLIRRKQNKPMVPPAIRETGSRIRDRFSRFSRGPISNAEYYREEPAAETMHSNKAYDNHAVDMSYAQPVKNRPPDNPPPYEANFKVAYLGAEDDDIYIYGNMDTEEDATWKVSNDRLEMGKALPDAKGKFADLKLATLHTGGSSKTVVAKMNKVGATDIEKLLMTAKMNFLATSVPANENLLQFIAAVPPPQGPMILMEYCTEGKLSDWLKNQKRVTDDVLDSMVNFCLQVAAGMTHLHGAEILHRRLGARNILLTMNQSKQIVAKVSGFGPMKGEQSGESKSKGDRVPFKWMAPEQFEVQDKGRIYTPATDVWSYGILLHEIFSKGAQPYPDMSNSDVKSKVASGYRMPKEQHCPDYVYDEVMMATWSHSAEDRPSFDIVLSNLKSYFQGGGGGQEEYVYDANE